MVARKDVGVAVAVHVAPRRAVALAFMTDAGKGGGVGECNSGGYGRLRDLDHKRSGQYKRRCPWMQHSNTPCALVTGRAFNRYKMENATGQFKYSVASTQPTPSSAEDSRSAARVLTVGSEATGKFRRFRRVRSAAHCPC